MTHPLPPGPSRIERAQRLRVLSGVVLALCALAGARYLAPFWVTFGAVPVLVAGVYLVATAWYLAGYEDGRDDGRLEGRR